jgi:hypothetical protein
MEAETEGLKQPHGAVANAWDDNEIMRNGERSEKGRKITVGR